MEDFLSTNSTVLKTKSSHWLRLGGTARRGEVDRVVQGAALPHGFRVRRRGFRVRRRGRRRGCVAGCVAGSVAGTSA